MSQVISVKDQALTSTYQEEALDDPEKSASPGEMGKTVTLDSGGGNGNYGGRIILWWQDGMFCSCFGSTPSF